MASTPFLTDLAKVVSETGKPFQLCAPFCAQVRRFQGTLVENARKALGARSCPPGA